MGHPIWIYIVCKTPSACSSCTEGVCDPVDGTCNIKECEPFILENGVVFGNVLVQGSRAKVKCNYHYKLTNGMSNLVCQSNGTWSSSPICLWDCWEPWTYYIKATVSPGETTNGTVRTYTCYNGFFISGNRNENVRNVTCKLGGYWEWPPRCVKDCGEPNNASVHYASYSEGEGLEDYDECTYTCPSNHVILSEKPYNTSDTRYSADLTNQTQHTIWCNGYHPKWKKTNFQCVKSCVGSPNITNVQNVNYTTIEDDVTATLTCLEGHAVFNGSATLELETFQAVCDEAGGTWTNDNFSCVMV